MNSLKYICKIVSAGLLLALTGCGGPLPPPDPPNLAQTKDSLNRGNYWYSRGCYQEAERFYLDGENSARLNDNVLLIIRAQNSQGAAALAQGETNRAANHLERALHLARAQPGAPEIDKILGNLGTLAQALNQPQDAEKFWLEAIRSTVGLTHSPIPYQVNLARLYLTKGRTEEFLALADLTLATIATITLNRSSSPSLAPNAASTFPLTPDKLILADVLNLAGQAAQIRGDLTIAEQHFREALELDRQLEYTPGLAQDTEALGRLLAELGPERNPEAASFLDRSFFLQVALGNDQEAGQILKLIQKLTAKSDLSSSIINSYQAVLKNPVPYRLTRQCP
ncbi:MAG: hypothetical protein AMR96_03020 [Candidatus Adiutrix intracellularis]|jgi:tetratricopeptide (TPR) repeat protein|nr:MAG: hypothetical protein AMR96_03020 [Candidatus Adiutrix intracellularis]MDR2826706.1 hypothetical protein [Candidatus Adiutrix intracellularis]